MTVGGKGMKVTAEGNGTKVIAEAKGKKLIVVAWFIKRVGSLSSYTYSAAC